MKKAIHAAVALTLLLLTALAGADGGTTFLKIAGRQNVDVARFTEEAAKSDVILIGEVHDSAAQHRQQMEIIRSLHARKQPLAIGVEMFAASGQKQLDEWVQGKLDEEEFRKVYASHWSYDWKLYRELFIFARDNRIPLIALNVPKPVMSKVVRQGSAALTAAERKELPPGGPWKLNATQMEYLKKIRSGFRPSLIPLENFAEAQALRNAAFAWNIARFREKTPKTKVVAIVGTWHAIRSGIAEDLKKLGNPAATVVLPKLAEINPEKLSVQEADFLMLAP